MPCNCCEITDSQFDESRAKVMRRMIRSAYLGLELGDTSSLVNPQAVEEIRRTNENI